MLSGDALDEAPVFAPDGRSFMFRRINGEPGIWVADADGSGARRAFDSTGYDLQTIEWSADGKTIVAMGGDPDLTEVDPAHRSGRRRHADAPDRSEISGTPRCRSVATS